MVDQFREKLDCAIYNRLPLVQHEWTTLQLTASQGYNLSRDPNLPRYKFIVAHPELFALGLLAGCSVQQPFEDAVPHLFN